MMHYKNKIKAIFIFFLSVSSSIHAYTREDLETWRTQSAYASIAIDAAEAATILGIADGAANDVLRCTLRYPMATNSCRINHVLSAALEKDPSWLCLSLFAIVATRFNSRYPSQERTLKEVLKPLLSQVITTILCAVTAKKLPGKKYTMIRRLLRVLIATTTRTTANVVAEKLVPSTYDRGHWSKNPMYILCSYLMDAIVTETLGAIVAQGIQEDKKQLA
ncbi:MAG: hypothetical protein WCW33_04535 [Candidatus Babeliales bacterium]|jgi:hypothetical protein